MDMRNTKLLEAFLKAIPEFSESCPTFLLSEVVLTYMAVNSCNGLIQWISEVLQNCVLCAYEQINPFDGFGQVMCSHFKKLGSPLKCILRYPTEKDQITRYKQAVSFNFLSNLSFVYSTYSTNYSKGFTNCYTVKASDFYRDIIQDKEKARIEKLELFDEYEAWHLKCTHYTLLSAVKGEFCDRITKNFYKKCEPKDVAMLSNLQLNDTFDAQFFVKLEAFPVKFGSRFGHKMCVVHSKLFVFGGFGELATDTLGKHLRLSAIEVVDLVKNELTVIELAENPIGDRIFHCCSTSGTNSIYLTYGRTNPSKLYDSIIKINVNAEDNGTVIDQSQLLVEKINFKVNDELSVLSRFRHATCSLPDSRLFVHGGKHFNEATNSNTTLGDAFVLDKEDCLTKINVIY